MLSANLDALEICLMEDNYSDDDAEDGLDDDHEYSRRAWTEPVVHLSVIFSLLRCLTSLL